MKTIIRLAVVAALFVSLAAPAAAERLDPGEKIRFDLRNAEIRTVINYMADLYGLVVIMPDDVKGKASITAPKEVTVEEAYGIVLAVMESQGYTLIRTDKLLKVVRKADAVQKPVDTSYGVDPELVPSTDGVITHIIPLRNIDASDVLSNLRPLISSTGNAFENRYTNSIVVTDSASNIKRLLSILKYLDVSDSGSGGDADTRVYSIRYMKAKDVADALQKVYQGKGDKQDVKITPVEPINALLVTCDMGTHNSIAKTIEGLDIRRRQVLISARIVEVTLSEGIDFGLELQRYQDSNSNFSYTVAAGAKVKDPFFTYSVSADKYDAFLRAVEGIGKVNILSSPKIMTTDNQKAKIVVGQEEPILKSTTDLGTEGSSGKTVSDYIYKDVGIMLEVTPRVNVDRDVSLDVSFTITSILALVDFGEVSVPRVGKREASTSVSVMDGRTLVIGGLIKKDERDERTGIPLLSRIPIIGWLFSHVKKETQRTELLVFITPQVVATSEEGDALTIKERGAMNEEFRELDNGTKSEDDDDKKDDDKKDDDKKDDDKKDDDKKDE